MTEVVIGAEVIAFDGRDCAPGDVLLVVERTAPLKFRWLTGVAGSPITVRNQGHVRINGVGDWVSVWFRDCEFFRLTGDGEPGVVYGFDLFGSPELGLAISHGCTSFEVDHISVHDCGFQGITAKTEVGQDGHTLENFRQRDFSLHDNWVYDVGHEGFYIGGGSQPELAMPIYGLDLARNRVERTGWDGIQVSSGGASNVRVHDNWVRAPAGLLKRYQDTGLLVVGVEAEVFGNVVLDAPGNAIYLAGSGAQQVYGNRVANAGYGESAAYRVSSHGVVLNGGSDSLVRNNLIVGIKGSGVHVGPGVTGVEACDNIIVAEGTYVSNALSTRNLTARTAGALQLGLAQAGKLARVGTSRRFGKALAVVGEMELSVMGLRDCAGASGANVFLHVNRDGSLAAATGQEPAVWPEDQE